MGDHVFVCYSRKDENFVHKLAENLKKQGVPIWLDQWDIPYGADWDQTIETALNECSCLLLAISPSSVESKEVRSEWRSALDENKVVVPILCQQCEIPYRLKTIQYIDFTSRSPDDEEAIGEILKALGMAGCNIKPIAQPEQTPEGLLNTLDSQKARNILDTASAGFKAKTEKPGTNKVIYGAIIIIIIFILSLTLYFGHDQIFGYTSSSRAVTQGPSVPKNAQSTQITVVTQKNQSTPNADAWISKGNELSNHSKYDEAIQAYDKAIELDPQNADAWFQKGNVFMMQGKNDEALQALNKVTQIDPQNKMAWDYKGITLHNLGRNDDAIQAYDRAIELDPQWYTPWLDKSSSLRALGRTAEADEAFAKAKELGY